MYRHEWIRVADNNIDTAASAVWGEGLRRE